MKLNREMYGDNIGYTPKHHHDIPESIVGPSYENTHLEHCLDRLRQAVMCHGDLTPSPLYVSKASRLRSASPASIPAESSSRSESGWIGGQEIKVSLRENDGGERPRIICQVLRGSLKIIAKRDICVVSPLVIFHCGRYVPNRLDPVLDCYRDAAEHMSRIAQYI